jgi:hypothetical protein
MGQITLRPELVTHHGEAKGILIDDRYVGTITLLYRQEEQIWGTVQLDEEVLEVDEKDQVSQYIHQYVDDMTEALGASDCFVTLSYSMFDYIISDDHMGEVEEVVEVIEDDQPYDEGDWESEHDKELQLAIVGESRHKVEYQLLGRDHHLIADAILTLYRGDVRGEINFHLEPTDSEIDEAVEIIVSDFDPDQIDTFYFTVFNHEQEKIAVLDLTHGDILDQEDEDVLYIDVYEDEDEDVQLDIDCVRDDIDAISYEVYEYDLDNHKELLGMVTIDVGQDEATAYMELLNPRDKKIREQIACRLIDELEDVASFDTLSITMAYQEEIIDEFVFDYAQQQERKPVANR